MTRTQKPNKMKAIIRQSHRLLPAVALTLFFLLGACRSNNATKQNYNDGHLRSPQEWTTMYAPVNVEITKPMSMGFSSRATFENNKYIHFSMRFIGMEVAQLYMNQDSVYFIDKYHKYMFAEPLSTILGERYNYLTIGDIQKILLGQTEVPQTDNITVAASDFVDTPAGPMASVISIDANTPQGTFIGLAEWNPSSAKWNEVNRKVNFKMPTNYKRITLSNLKSMLKSMSF